MGYELRRMIRDGAPREWTGPMVHVASEIADSVWADPSQDPGACDTPVSTIPITGCFDRAGRWRDGLTERTGMSTRAVSRALTDLAAAGYEMRQVIGKTDDGRPVYAARGHAVRFTVPILPPRAVPEAPPKPESLPSTASYVVGSPVDDPGLDAKDGELSGRKDAKYGDQSGGKLAKDGEPIVLRKTSSKKDLLPSAATVAAGPVENSPPGHRAEDHFQGSFLVGVRGGASGRRSRWRDPQDLALEQLANARAHHEQIERAAATP